MNLSLLVRSTFLGLLLFINYNTSSLVSDTNYTLCLWNGTDLSLISRALTTTELLKGCHENFTQKILGKSFQHHEQVTKMSAVKSEKPTDFQRYVFGFIAVFIVSALSLVGLLVLPLLYKMSFKYVLNLFTAISTGTLLGDTMFHLIPFIFDLHSDDLNGDQSASSKSSYQWKILLAVFMLYIFYLLEVFLHWFAHYKHDHSTTKLHLHDHLNNYNKALYTTVNLDADLEHIHLHHNHKHHNLHQHLNSPSIYSNANSFFHPASTPSTPCPHSDEHPITTNQFFADNLKRYSLTNQNEQVSLTPKHFTSQLSEEADYMHPIIQQLKTIKSTGWMVLFGDSVHNFADGLAIAAAFSQDIMLGITTTFAIACHELPHELGDYTVLLQSGFSHSRALLWNFLSAATAILGFLIGSIMLVNEHVRQWIFAATIGMFLYIALVDLLPTLLADEGVEFKRFLVVNIGFLFGITIMFLLALFESKITKLSIR